MKVDATVIVTFIAEGSETRSDVCWWLSQDLIMMLSFSLESIVYQKLYFQLFGGLIVRISNMEKLSSQSLLFKNILSLNSNKNNTLFN